MKLRKIITLILIISMMIIIFMFSSQNGTSSSGLSSKFSNIFIDIFIRKYDTYSLSRQKEIFSNVSYGIRKLAHMTEYGILGSLVFLFLFGIKMRYRIIFSISFCFIYASTDELHQRFVGGRSGQFKDVMIDTLGAIIFVLTFSLVVLIFKKRKLRKLNKFN